MMVRTLFIIVCTISLSYFPLQAKTDVVAEALCSLTNFSKQTHADALYVLKNGQPFFHYQTDPYDVLIDTQEIAQTFIAFAIVLLIDEGKIPCLDVSVKHFEIENDLTLRQLLNSSFIASKADPIAPLLQVIEKASGLTFDNYLLKRLFLPLEIRHLNWSSNEEERCPHLFMTCWDLARVGQLIVEKGLSHGKRIINEHALNLLFQSSEHNPFIGLQWKLGLYDASYWWDDELLQAYREANLDKDTILCLEMLQGRNLSCSGQFYKTYYLNVSESDINEAFGSKEKAQNFIGSALLKGLPMARFIPGKVKSISAIGKGGQQLFILPDHKIVAVRQKKNTCIMDDEINVTFGNILRELAKPSRYPLD